MMTGVKLIDIGLNTSYLSALIPCYLKKSTKIS